MKNNVEDKEKLRIFHSNIDGMKQILGQPLYNFKRKLDENLGKNDFARKLEREHKAAYDAAKAYLPGSSTLSNQMRGKNPLKEDTVEKIAQFCSEAFMFDEVITRDDLLTRQISFPELYRTGQWSRYVGIYRCFYFYPGRKNAAELHGGLLKLWEKSGKLHAFLVTGLRRDRYIQELEQKIEGIPPRQLEEKLYSVCQEYSRGHSDVDMGLVMYQGVVQMSMIHHLLMQLQRCGRSSVAVLALHRRDESAQNNYSGGIASVTLCRSSNITSYPMAVVRHKLFLEQDREFLEEYLRAVNNGVKGFRITNDTDTEWNQEHLRLIRDRSERE